MLQNPLIVILNDLYSLCFILFLRPYEPIGFFFFPQLANNLVSDSAKLKRLFTHFKLSSCLELQSMPSPHCFSNYPAVPVR